MANRKVANAVRLALVAAGAASAGFGTPVVVAQDTEMEQIVVTGSRIRIRDFDAISPVSTVTADQIQSTGNLNMEGVLNQLPQVVPGFTANSNNPSDGTATVDLRGIGPTRTLVLVNGRRLTPSTQTGRTDLNNVPTRLVERVEVVTGGASAVYGSDALAGVVNFVLKQDFDGVDVGYNFGVSDRGDGNEDQVDVLLGSNFADGRGNMTAYASWYERDVVVGADRSWSAVDIFSNGSNTGNAFLPNAALNAFPNYNEFFGSGGTGRNYAFNLNNDGGIRPRINAMPETNNGVGDRYNFAPVNNIQSPGERINLASFGNLQLSEKVNAYVELMYVDSRNSSQLAPTPAVNVAFDPASPLLTQEVQDLLALRPDPDGTAFLTRRMVEVGARVQENQSKLVEGVLGFRGETGFKDWEYDAYALYGKNDFTNITYNDVSKSKFGAGLSGCPEDYARFVPSCVPVNAFGVGSITPEQAAFIRLDFTDRTEFERYLVAASVNGSLVDLPAGPLGFAAGVEYREDSSSFVPDLAKKSGDILGFNAQQPVDGSFNVTEIYAEALVPLLKDLPGAQALNLELGGRFSDYTSVGNVEAYKAGLEWAPIDMLRVRGMYQRAVRAPSVFELFQAGDVGFPQAFDPCASTRPNGTTVVVPADVAAFCQDTWGIDAATYVQSNSQIESFFYGNPDLIEETSDTYTVGFALTPMQNLSIALDWWSIEIQDYVNTLAGGPVGVITECFATLDINSSACYSDALGQPLVFRDEVADLKAVAPLANVSELKTSGVDFQLNYGLPMAWAGGPEWLGDTLTFTLLTTYLDSYELDGIEYAGTIGSYNIAAALPEWKGNLRIGYDLGPVALAWNINYIDAMDNQGNIPAFEDGGYIGTDSETYHDVSARWQINDTFEFGFGVRNLTDIKPPYFDWPLDGNTDPSTYDALGRYYFGSLRAKF